MSNYTGKKYTVRLLKETLLACNIFVVIKCNNNTLIYKANYSTVIIFYHQILCMMHTVTLVTVLFFYQEIILQNLKKYLKYQNAFSKHK